MTRRSHTLVRLCGACALTGVALGGATALAGGLPASSPAALAVHLANSPTLVGGDTHLAISVTDAEGAPLGRLAISDLLPGGVVYVPHSARFSDGGSTLLAAAPKVTLQAGVGTRLVWTDLAVPLGHLVVDFTVRPEAGSSTGWDGFGPGTTWTSVVAVRGVATHPQALPGPFELPIDGAVAASATDVVHVEPLSLATGGVTRAGAEQVTVTGMPAGPTTDVVVRAYLPTGIEAVASRSAQHGAVPIITRVLLPTQPGHADLPDLAPAPAAAAASATTVAGPATEGVAGASGITGTSGASGAAGNSGVSGAAGNSGVSGAAGNSGVSGAEQASGAASTSSASGAVPTTTPGAQPVATTPAPVIATDPEADTRPFTVLTWRIGTLKAGAKVTERYAVYADDLAGAQGSWLITATGSSLEAGSDEPVSLTIDALGGWTDGVRVGDVALGSTPSTTVADPFGNPGNTSATTTPPTPTTASTAGAAPVVVSSSSTSVAAGKSDPTTGAALPTTGANARLELEVAMAALLLGAGVVVTTRPRRLATVEVETSAVPAGGAPPLRQRVGSILHAMTNAALAPTGARAERDQEVIELDDDGWLESLRADPEVGDMEWLASVRAANESDTVSVVVETPVTPSPAPEEAPAPVAEARPAMALPPVAAGPLTMPDDFGRELLALFGSALGDADSLLPRVRFTAGAKPVVYRPVPAPAEEIDFERPLLDLLGPIFVAPVGPASSGPLP